MKRKHQQRYVKKSKSFIVLFFLILCIFGRFNIVNATCSSGIKGNGTNGISININAAPYTTFAGYSYGQYAYGKEGCAWFASARVKELTGQGNTIFSGWAWYNTQYSNYGFSRGSVPKAKSLACYGNHVAVVEAVNGDTVTVSQGGMSGLSDAAHGYCVISTMSRSKLESQGGCGTFYGYVYMNASEPNPQPTKFECCLDYPKANSDYVDSVYIAGWVKVPSGCTNVTGWCNGNAFDIPLHDRSDVANGKGFHGYIPASFLKNGTNTLDIFAYHNTETWNVCSIKINYKDSQAPTISNCIVSDMTRDGFKVSCNVNDNVTCCAI